MVPLIVMAPYARPGRSVTDGGNEGDGGRPAFSTKRVHQEAIPHIVACHLRTRPRRSPCLNCVSFHRNQNDKGKQHHHHHERDCQIVLGHLPTAWRRLASVSKSWLGWSAVVSGAKPRSTSRSSPAARQAVLTAPDVGRRPRALSKAARYPPIRLNVSGPRAYCNASHGRLQRSGSGPTPERPAGRWARLRFRLGDGAAGASP